LAGSAVNTGATGPTGYGTFLQGNVSTIQAGGGNKVQGPGMVYNTNGSQLFYLYDSFGNQINSGQFANAWQITNQVFFYVPGNLYVASNSTAFLWIKYT
jgi:hypothetical protein